MFLQGAAFCRCLLALTIAAPLAAQDASDAAVQGIVTAANTGQALNGALVTLEAAGQAAPSTLTSRDGLYQIGGIPPGSYTLRIRRLGYETFERPLVLEPGARETISVRLESEVVPVEGVVALGQRGAAHQDQQRQQITPENLRRIPTPAPSGDLASYIQAMPGVVSLGDRGGQLFIRGGTHTENLTLIDGLTIFQPFHIVGFFSAFPENLVSGVDYYAGGFGARYSGRTSSVLDVRMRDGDLNRYRGTAAVSPFVADVTVEGPITRGENAFILSAKRSLIRETSASFLKEEQPLSFESQFAKLSLLGNPDARCTAMAIRTVDEGRLDPQDEVARVDWSNYVAGGRCVALMDASQRFIDISGGYSAVENEAVSRNSSNFYSKATRLQFDLNATQLFGRARVEMGGFLRYETLDYDLAELFSLQRASESLISLGNYLEAELVRGDLLRVQPGIAITYSPTPGMEPRLRMGWRPFGPTGGELTGAAGIYRQFLAGISDMRDAASVFVAWRKPPGDRPITATHAMFGWQQSLGNDLDVSVEGYYKWMEDIPVPLWRTTAEFTTELVRANGRTKGTDARAEYARGPLYAFLGYGYSETVYRSAQEHFSIWFGDPVQKYYPPHDRRHQVNAILGLDFGGVRASARWQLGTGLPVTLPIGFDEAFDFRYRIWNPSRIPGTTRMILDRPYSGRMPYMHRLDTSLVGSWNLPFAEVQAQAGAINVYDRTNMFYYDLYTQSRVDQLRFVPYLTLKVESR